MPPSLLLLRKCGSTVWHSPPYFFSKRSQHQHSLFLSAIDPCSFRDTSLQFFDTIRDSSLFEVPHWMHISYFNSEGLSTTDNPLSSLLPSTSSSSSSSLPAFQQRQSPSILSGSSEVPWSMRTGTYGPRGIEGMEGLLEGVREKSIVPPPSLGPSLLPNGMAFRQGGRDGGREGGDCWSHQHQKHLDYHILGKQGGWL